MRPIQFSGTSFIDARSVATERRESFITELNALPRTQDLISFNQTVFIAKSQPDDDDKYVRLAAQYGAEIHQEAYQTNYFDALVPHLMSPAYSPFSGRDHFIQTVNRLYEFFKTSAPDFSEG